MPQSMGCEVTHFQEVQPTRRRSMGSSVLIVVRHSNTRPAGLASAPSARGGSHATSSELDERNKDVAQAVIKQTPRGQIGSPEEVAAAVLWLSSDAGSFAVGTVLAIDGGYMA